MSTRLTLVLFFGCHRLVCQRQEEGPAEIGNRDVGKGINFYSIEKEIALGQQLALEVEKQAKMVDDPILGEYINRLGQNLVRNSDAKMPVSFKIIDDDSVKRLHAAGRPCLR